MKLHMPHCPGVAFISFAARILIFIVIGSMSAWSQGAVLSVSQGIIRTNEDTHNRSAGADAGRIIVPSGSNESASNFPSGILSDTNAWRVRSNMAFVPGGSFTMGNSLDPKDGDADELPEHRVQVSAFYMDKYDVTKELWDKVFFWATNHGYNFSYGTWGKAAKHPIISVNWYDAVKWCNARSEMEGRSPAYFTNSDLSVPYRNGETAPFVNWTNGYRLPTEAEWEKAARGGLDRQRFPWGNIISSTQANVYAYPSGYAYDVNTTSGYHPTFNDGTYPFTNPVDYFSPNNYGIYDMAGNVYQWCWDWYGPYADAPQSDPHGPHSGSARMFRGGGWGGNAFRCRVAARYYYFPTYKSIYLGFRTVLSGSPDNQ